MLLIRSVLYLILYLILFFFVMQLDAYFYLRGVIDFAPFVQVLFITFVVFCGYIFFKRKHIPVRLSRESFFLLSCLFLYISVQIFGIAVWDSVPSDKTALVFWLYMLVLLFLGVISGELAGDRTPDILFSLLVMLTILLLVDAVFGGLSESEKWGRPAATLRNPNEAAFAIVLLLLGSLRWQRLRLIEICAVVIAGVSIVLTQSRGGMLAFLVIILCYSIWWGGNGRTSIDRAKRYLLAGLFGLTAIGIAVTVLFSRRYGSDGIDEMLSVVLSDSNARDNAINIALELISNKPIFGNGTGFVYTQQLGPHNMLLRAWVENGVPGLFGIMALFLGLMWVGVVRKDQSVITLVIVLFVLAMTTHNLTEARSLLIVTGMLLANSSRKKVVNYSPRVILHNNGNVQAS